MAKKSKFYVVWTGRRPGIYFDWASAKAQVDGFEGARYKSFLTQREAEEAFLTKPKPLPGYMMRPKASESDTPPPTPEPLTNAIAVDAACSGNPGLMEYRGVTLWEEEPKEIFHNKFPVGTNNVGEFLAIVHAMALLEQKNADNITIYSDSQTAISWVLKGKANTHLKQTPLTYNLLDLVARAEQWLATHSFRSPLVKWPTAHWGEIPADFGRK